MTPHAAPAPEVDLVLGVLVTSDGAIERRQLDPSWLGIRDALGCEWLDGATLPYDVRFWVDDEGQLTHKPRNELGTRIAHALGWPGSVILAGPVLFIGINGPECVGLPEEIAHWIDTHFGKAAALREYRITFGQKYAREAHPVFPAAHPDGWVTILASDYASARATAFASLGRFWGDLYDMELKGNRFLGDVLGHATDWSLFPRGELGRIAATPEGPSTPAAGGGEDR